MSITTVNIMTLSITKQSTALRMYGSGHSNTQYLSLSLYADCSYSVCCIFYCSDECHYATCHNAECRGAIKRAIAFPACFKHPRPDPQNFFTRVIICSIVIYNVCHSHPSLLIACRSTLEWSPAGVSSSIPGACTIKKFTAVIYGFSFLRVWPESTRVKQLFQVLF